LKFTASKQFSFYIVFITTLLFASALRLPHLAQRPMHTDEAVHALKFAALLEHNSYSYDPFEYHGPTLIYSTLLPAWFSGDKDIRDVNEVTLRIVPALYGLGLLLLLLGFRRALGSRSILFAALLTALSPAFVFYSRYYIMEILLVFFTFAAMLGGWKFARTQKIGWALLTGVAIGLMHATKETCALAWLAMGAAVAFTLLWERKLSALQHLRWRGVLFGALAAAVVSMLFFSSFFSNPHGIIDSIATYKTYVNRGAGGFQAHVYPWYQYAKWLFASHMSGRPLWTEAIILLLSIFGFASIFSRRRDTRGDRPFLRFLALYTLLLSLLYMIIPYKTPWSMLGFYHGFILVAAVGADEIFSLAKSTAGKWAVASLLTAALLHLGWQTVELNFKYDADISNPYVYAHTDPDIFLLTGAIKDITKYSPDGKSTYIEVVCPNADYWPLPWYLRRYNNVGYFAEFDNSLPAGDLIVTMPALETSLLKKLYDIPPPGQRDMYIPQFERSLWLRPGVQIDLYVRKDVWDIWYRNSP